MVKQEVRHLCIPAVSTHIGSTLRTFTFSPSKSVDHTTAGRHDGCGSKKHTDQRKAADCLSVREGNASYRGHRNTHQKADSSSIVVGDMLKNLRQRTGSRINDVVDVAGNEEQHNQEYRSGSSSDEDTSNHDFGAHHGGVGNFFNHMRNAILE